MKNIERLKRSPDIIPDWLLDEASQLAPVSTQQPPIEPVRLIHPLSNSLNTQAKETIGAIWDRDDIGSAYEKGRISGALARQRAKNEIYNIANGQSVSQEGRRLDLSLSNNSIEMRAINARRRRDREEIRSPNSPWQPAIESLKRVYNNSKSRNENFATGTLLKAKKEAENYAIRNAQLDVDWQRHFQTSEKNIASAISEYIDGSLSGRNPASLRKKSLLTLVDDAIKWKYGGRETLYEESRRQAATFLQIPSPGRSPDEHLPGVLMLKNSNLLGTDPTPPANSLPKKRSILQEAIAASRRPIQPPYFNEPSTEITPDSRVSPIFPVRSTIELNVPRRVEERREPERPRLMQRVRGFIERLWRERPRRRPSPRLGYVTIAALVVLGVATYAYELASAQSQNQGGNEAGQTTDFNYQLPDHDLNYPPRPDLSQLSAQADAYPRWGEWERFTQQGFSQVLGKSADSHTQNVQNLDTEEASIDLQNLAPENTEAAIEPEVERGTFRIESADGQQINLTQDFQIDLSGLSDLVKVDKPITVVPIPILGNGTTDEMRNAFNPATNPNGAFVLETIDNGSYVVEGHTFELNGTLPFDWVRRLVWLIESGQYDPKTDVRFIPIKGHDGSTILFRIIGGKRVPAKLYSVSTGYYDSSSGMPEEWIGRDFIMTGKDNLDFPPEAKRARVISFVGCDGEYLGEDDPDLYSDRVIIFAEAYTLVFP